jgi:hypothetical protein
VFFLTHVLCVLMLFFISSCDKQKAIEINSTRQTLLAESKKVAEYRELGLDEIKYDDIPIPMGSCLVKKGGCGVSRFFVYDEILPLDKIKKFYEQEMERLGWDISIFSNDNEELLFCRKTTKSCAISVCSKNREEVKKKPNFKTIIKLSLKLPREDISESSA